MRRSFLTGPDTGPAWWHQDGVGRGHIRGRVTVEHDLDFHAALAHPVARQRFRHGRDDRNRATTVKVQTKAVPPPAPQRAQASCAAAERPTTTSTYLHQCHLSAAT